VILLLDHDDSFVFNLARYVAELGAEARVVRASSLSLADVAGLRPDRIILSPGPGTPRDCPLAIAVVRQLGPSIPILGVCLGHQCIAEAYRAVVTRARRPRHGMTSPISHDGRGVLTGLPSPFRATRYHSLAISPDHVPAELELTAFADDGEIMGVRHRVHPVEGVQFHPESVSTEHGHQLLQNFIQQENRG
jgi:anthranilate synthase/aminodeoxychorismate synthase-like glutamine amidotransferase